MNLFELNTKYKELSNRNDLDPTLLKDSLDSINDDYKVKLNNIAKWIESLNADTDWLKKKKKSINDELIYRNNLRKNLMTYLTNAIDDRGDKEVHTNDFILRPRNYRQTVYIDDPNKIPVDYVDEKTTYKPNKKRIYAALKAGKKVAGVELHPNRKVVIK